MPLYEYLCDACGHRFELIQKFSDPPVTTCPKCSGVVHKVISAPAFQLKGTGWYITDYAKKDSTGTGASAKDEKPEANAKDGTGAKSDGPEKVDKADKADKTDKPAATTEKSAAPPAASTSSTGDTKS